jgi:replicative DNA helicase
MTSSLTLKRDTSHDLDCQSQQGGDEIDNITSGGLGRNELGVVIAPTGAGKSMALVHLGSEAIKEGKTVVHYTLELQDTVVACRYDSCITQYPLSDLSNFKDEIYEEIKDLDGTLIVKEYPTKSASTNTIKAHLSRLVKRGIEPGMIIVDYADLLRPVVIRKEKRAELESIYEELRGISNEFNCPVWTASQTNRSGLNAEVVTMEQISEAFNKCFVSDFICTLSRTIEDKQNNRAKMFIAKNRNGPDGMIYDLFMDTSNVSIKILAKPVVPAGAAAQVATNPVTIDAKGQREILKNKYDKFRKLRSKAK